MLGSVSFSHSSLSRLHTPAAGLILLWIKKKIQSDSHTRPARY